MATHLRRATISLRPPSHLRHPFQASHSSSSSSSSSTSSTLTRPFLVRLSPSLVVIFLLFTSFYLLFSFLIPQSSTHSIPVITTNPQHHHSTLGHHPTKNLNPFDNFSCLGDDLLYEQGPYTRPFRFHVYKDMPKSLVEDVMVRAEHWWKPDRA